MPQQTPYAAIRRWRRMTALVVGGTLISTTSLSIVKFRFGEKFRTTYISTTLNLFLNVKQRKFLRWNIKKIGLFFQNLEPFYAVFKVPPPYATSTKLYIFWHFWTFPSRNLSPKKKSSNNPIICRTEKMWRVLAPQPPCPKWKKKRGNGRRK